MLTLAQLKLIAPILAKKPGEAEKHHPPLLAAMKMADINTPYRVAGFLSQVLHECGEFRWMEEIWGPKGNQPNFEPPAELAKRLGNVNKGDGYRYRGRGTVQLTGRYNYREFGKWAGFDAENNPDLVATHYAHMTAAYYWNRTRLNPYSDLKDILGLSQMVFFGTTKGVGEPMGWSERKRYWDLAVKTLVSPKPRSFEDDLVLATWLNERVAE